MADLRIVDAPEIPTENITGKEKLPTGGSGNYSISLDSLADYTKTKKDLVDNITVDNKVNGVRQELNTHIEDLLNPHQVTKGQIGLGNVDNTADADKPVSNSTQAAIISAVAPKADKADVYTKSETYTKQESSDLVNNSISTALTPINKSLDLSKRGIANHYDSSLTYNSGERVVLDNGDIVKSTVDGNANNPNTDLTGWVKTNSTSQIFDESGKTQQVLNNSILAILNKQTTPEDFGAKGDGVVDDTAAIQAAIDSISSSAFVSGLSLDEYQKRGTVGTVRLISKYRITDTVYLSPMVQVIGLNGSGWSFSSGTNNAPTVIADLADPKKAAICSSNWKADGTRPTVDFMATGLDINDNKIISIATRLKVKGFNLVTAEGKSGFIGLKLQGANQSEVDIFTRGFDYGFIGNACIDSKFYVQSISKRCGALLIHGNNATTIDGYFYSIGGSKVSDTVDIINASTNITIQTNIADSVINGVLRDVNTSYGLVTYDNFGLVSNKITSEANAVGLMNAKCSLVINQYYGERNTYCSSVNYDGNLNFGSITGYDDYGFIIGSSSSVNVDIYNRRLSTPDARHIKYLNASNTYFYVPKNFPEYAYGIIYNNPDHLLFVGNDIYARDDFSGADFYRTVRTLDEAIKRIKQYTTVAGAASQSNAAWTIVVKSGTYTLSSSHELNCDIDFIAADAANKPTIDFAGALTLNGSKLHFKNVHVSMASNIPLWAVVSINGRNSISINDGNLSLKTNSTFIILGGATSTSVELIINNSVIDAPANNCRLIRSSGTSPHLVSAVISSNSTISPNITSRADKGFEFDDNWKVKILGI